LIEDWQHGGFGLYLHWPFCQAKCPYCDFNSHVSSHVDQSRWKAAFLSEIERAGYETSGRVLRSVFFGGGTPSLMDPDLVASVLQKISQTWPLANDVEITLEANPTSVEASRFAGFRDAGVNRISMGLQAFNDKDLKRLGRLHSAAEGLAAFDTARNIFSRVSFDLIYARQDQSLSDWKIELAQALAFSAEHMSLYQLTIEGGTAFGDRFEAGKLRGLPDEDLAADMYFVTQEMCEKAGKPAYEVSNHAKTGHESRHNLIYWRGGDYVGVGPGAHGRLTLNGQRNATETALLPTAWLERVEKLGSGETHRTTLSPTDQSLELLMMGLRIHGGVELNRLKNLNLDNKINGLIELNLLETTDSVVRTTSKGLPLLNSIIRTLLP
jgi:oxygen-independent coproporphyrinogen-3 oxidase